MIKAILILGAMLLFVSVSNNVFAQVKSDYDKSTNFSKYKTYTFGGWEKDSDKILTNFDKKRVTEAMANEFNSRGMSHVESGGDAVITLFIVIKQKTSITAYTDFNGGMGYYSRRGWGMGYGGMGLSATTTYSENDYLEGTFVVDMYDSESKELIWQGIITTIIKEKPSKREKTIPKKVKKLMKKFPIKPMK